MISKYCVFDTQQGISQVLWMKMLTVACFTDVLPDSVAYS